MSKNKEFPVDIEQIGDIKLYLHGKSTEEIEGIINNLHEALQEKKRENVREIYEKLTEDISALGYETIHDFMAAAENFGIIKSNRAPRPPIPIRYRNKFNPEETWTGRGKQPKWLQALLAKGHEISEFEVPPEELEQVDQEVVEQDKPAKKSKTQKKVAANKAPQDTTTEPELDIPQETTTESETNVQQDTIAESDTDTEQDA